MGRHKRYLIVIWVCFIILCLATAYEWAYGQEVGVHPHCVPEAVYCAWGWGAQTGERTQIAVSHIQPGIDHVQSQAFHRNQWTYLTATWDKNKGVVCVPSKRHFNIEPYRYVGLRKFINEQVVYIKGGN